MGARRGPAQLRFRALLDDIRATASQLPEMRQQGKVDYSLPDCYLSAFALFFLQDPSVLEFQRRFQDQIQRNNLSTVFGVEEIPSDSQLREVLDTHEYAAVAEVFRRWFAKLQRSKKLERYQLLGGYYLVSLDGSEYFTSEHVHCDYCLSRHKSNGHTEYYHQILQQALVARGAGRSFPSLLSSFVLRMVHKSRTVK